MLHNEDVTGFAASSPVVLLFIGSNAFPFSSSILLTNSASFGFSNVAEVIAQADKRANRTGEEAFYANRVLMIDSDL